MNAELHARHQPLRDRFEWIWRDLLRTGLEEGKFAFQDLNMTTRALLGLMNWLVTWYHPDGEMSIDEISNQYADLVLFRILEEIGGLNVFI